MRVMEDQRKRIGLGRIISTLGIVWFGLFFAARSGLFGSNPFTTVILGMGALFPLVLMFAGRVIRRRSKRTPVESVEPAPPRPRPTPPPQRQRPAPDPVTVEERADTVKSKRPEETLEPIETEPVSSPMPIETEIGGMTSEEMVAEAKKRYSSGS